MNRALFLLIAWALCLTPLLVYPLHAQAFSITDYHQDQPGRADGVIIIDELDYSITELAVQIATASEPVDFDLIQQGNQVHVVIRDAHQRTTSTAMTVTVVSNRITQPRTFLIKGKASHASSRSTPALAERAPDNVIELDYAALATTDTVADGTLEININGGQTLRTVRQAVELLLYGSSITLNERLGDDRALDAMLDDAYPVNRLEDIYIASKGEVGHIYIDGSALVVVPKGAQQHIELEPASAESTPLSVTDAENPPEKKSEKTPAITSTTLRALVTTLCAKYDVKLDEQLGDDRLLDQSVVIEHSIETFEQLYRIENTPVHQVVFDTRNGVRTVRLL